MRVEITAHYKGYRFISHCMPSTESSCFIDNEVCLSKFDLLHLWVVEQMSVTDDHHLFGPIVTEQDQHRLVVLLEARCFHNISDIVKINEQSIEESKHVRLYSDAYFVIHYCRALRLHEAHSVIANIL